MNFLNVGPLELMLVLVVALIVFGPQRLPEIGATVGRTIREFQRAQQEIVQEFSRELKVESERSSPTSAVLPPQQPVDSAPANTPAGETESRQTSLIPEQMPGATVVDTGTRGEEDVAG